MKPREVPGALALGLLASLAAHAALYGNEHEMGGAFAGEFLSLAVAAMACLALAFGALAWIGASTVTDGSILGTRLAARLPGLVPVLASAVLFFTLGERIEPQHESAMLPFIAVVLAAASWLVLALARGAVKALAGAIVAVVRSPFAPREPFSAFVAVPVVRTINAPLLRRRFARPPPVC